MIRQAELARLLHKKSPAYRIYEYNDMLGVLTELLAELALEGEVVQIRNLGTFYPHETKPRTVYDVKQGKHKEVQGNILLKFKPARRIQDKIKALVQQERSQNETNLANT